MPAIDRLKRAPGGLAASLLGLVLVASGCYVRGSQPVTVERAETCPDFSGAYYFPGGKDDGGACSLLDSPHHPQGAAFRWPHPDGGFAELRSPAVLRIVQGDCSELEIQIHYSSSRGQQIEKITRRSLVRRYERQKIVWTEDSLTYEDRIKPAPSFTLAPVNAAREEFFLQQVPGALVYRASYWEASEGERSLTACTLPLATAADWRSIGIEPPGSGAGPGPG